MIDERQRREVQGKRIRMARAGANLSRDRFAELVSELWEDVSREYVRRVEIGEKDPGLGFLIAAAEVTDQPLPWFTELEDTSPRYDKLDGVVRPTDNRPPSREAA